MMWSIWFREVAGFCNLGKMKSEKNWKKKLEVFGSSEKGSKMSVWNQRLYSSETPLSTCPTRAQLYYTRWHVRLEPVFPVEAPSGENGEEVSSWQIKQLFISDYSCCLRWIAQLIVWIEKTTDTQLGSVNTWRECYLLDDISTLSRQNKQFITDFH